MISLKFLLVISMFVVNSYGQSAFDQLVDEILFEAEQKMINESNTNIALPDINLPINKKFLLWNMKGDIITKGGFVGNMSTIKRIGDVSPIENNNEVVIPATFGMSNLFIHFDDLNFDFLFFHIKDGINIGVGRNAISFNVSFLYDSSGNCSVKLNEAEVTSLGSFHTTLLPTGFLHTLADYFITGMLDLFSGEVKTLINAHLTSELDGIIQKLDLCDKLPFSNLNLLRETVERHRKPFS